MTFGAFNAYGNDYTFGSNTKYNLGSNAVRTSFEGAMLLGETKNGAVTGDASIYFGYGSPQKGTQYREYGLDANVQYNKYVGDNFDVGVKAGVDAGYGYTFTGGNDVALGSWPGYGVISIEGEQYPVVRPHLYPYVEKRNPRVFQDGGFQVTPSVSAEVGYTNFNDARTSIYGTVGKDIVNGDTFKRVGARYETPVPFIEDYTGVEATVFVNADYTFNNKNKTTSFINRQGASIGIGGRITF